MWRYHSWVDVLDSYLVDRWPLCGGAIVGLMYWMVVWMVVSVDRWPLCGGAIVGLMYWMVVWMVVSVDRWPLCGGAIVGLMYWMVVWMVVLCRQVAFMYRCYSWVDVLDGSLAVTQDRLFLSEVVFNCISAFARSISEDKEMCIQLCI